MSRVGTPRLREDMIGRVFGRLTVTARAENMGTRARWSCSCSCGGTTEASGTALRTGKVQSCGCLPAERGRVWGATARKTHGASRTAEHDTWLQMRARCERDTDPRYPGYGGRGIKVCARWRGDFASFLADMGPRPDGMSIDRIDNDQGYDCGKCDDCAARGVTKTNCRWATSRTQANNMRSNRLVTLDGETLTLATWGRRLDIPLSTLRSRLARGASTVAEATGSL